MTSDALDKVFALLGMSSDTIPTALLPDYEIPWETLLERLVQFLLGEQVSVKAWAHTEMAVVEGKGSVLGKVSSVRSNIAGNGGQDVDIIFNDLNISKQSGYRGGKTARWTLQFSAKPIQAGDLICLLQGASKPTIMRSCKDYFAIVMIAATPLEDTQAATRDLERPTLLQSVKAFTRDFLLVWDWKNSPTTSQDLERYTTSMGQDNWVSDLDDSTRLWNVALILEDAKEHEIARQKFQEATKGYEKAVGEYYPYTLKSEYIQTPLSWAAGNGCGIVVELLLKKDGIDPDLKESQSGLTPLSRAAGEGHEAVAKLLLATGKVDIHSKENSDRTALSRAAEKGHEAVVKLLLATGEVDVDSKGTVYGQTPLSWAAEKGHEAVVKLLLATGKVNIDSKDNHGRTPLWWAASGGHEAVVKLLLATGKVDVDSKDNDGLTPLWWAARHEAVVKLLRSHIPHAAQ
jgi:ankyrin repeat protein